jgi:hypothetical protein
MRISNAEGAWHQLTGAGGSSFEESLSSIPPLAVLMQALVLISNPMRKPAHNGDFMFGAECPERRPPGYGTKELGQKAGVPVDEALDLTLIPAQTWKR